MTKGHRLVLSSLDARSIYYTGILTLEALANAGQAGFLEGEGAPVPVSDFIDFNPALPLKKGQARPTRDEDLRRRVLFPMA